MRIGLDLDDTITDLPRFFGVVTKALLETGSEVHVITFRDPDTRAAVEAELADLGIHYTAVHLPERGISAPLWKRRVAGELGLDIMFDDSPEVLERMPVGVRRMWLCDPEVFDLGTCIRALGGKPAD